MEAVAKDTTTGTCTVCVVGWLWWLAAVSNWTGACSGVRSITSNLFLAPWNWASQMHTAEHPVVYLC